MILRMQTIHGFSFLCITEIVDSWPIFDVGGINL